MSTDRLTVRTPLQEAKRQLTLARTNLKRFEYNVTEERAERVAKIEALENTVALLAEEDAK